MPLIESIEIANWQSLGFLVGSSRDGARHSVDTAMFGALLPYYRAVVCCGAQIQRSLKRVATSSDLTIVAIVNL